MLSINLLVLLAVLSFARGENLLQLTIIHYNDIHARFEETSPTSTRCLGTNCVGGISRLYTAIMKIHDEQPNPIVLNAGDSFQGTLWYTVYKWNATQYFLNKLPCDAYVLGNHEFDDSIDGVVPFMKALKCPIVVCNMDASEEPRIQGLYTNTTVVIRNGTKIGIIGVIVSNTNKISNTEKLRFLPEISSVNLAASSLSLYHNVTFSIVLSHCGIEMDRQIALHAHPSIAVVVGGHSHTFLYSGSHLPGPDKPAGPYPVVVKSKLGRDVLVVQAGKNNKYVGNLTVWVQEGRLKKWEGNVVYLDQSVPQDPAIEREIQEWKKEIDSQGNTVLGSSKVFLNRNTRRTGECILGSFLADAMVNYYVNQANNESWTYAPIGIVNSGAIRTSINPGKITRNDLITCHPFENTIDVVELSGKSIVELLEYSVTPSVVRNGQLHEFLQISGMRVRFNLSKPPGSRVVSVKVLCQDCLTPSFAPVNLTAIYRVVTLSYLVYGGDGYNVIWKNKLSWKSGPAALEVFSDYVQTYSPIVQVPDERIIIEEREENTKVNGSSVYRVPVIFYIIVYTCSILL